MCDYLTATPRAEWGCDTVGEATRGCHLKIENDGVAQGCERVLSGCTEIPVRSRPDQLAATSFDSKGLDADMGIEFLFSR